MDAGFKRNVKYISLMQLKFLGWIILFGCMYGVLMGFMSGGGLEEMKQTGLQYFTMLLLIIMPMSLQLRYVKNIAGFVLSMGCTRKNIIIGQHILSLEILVESIVLFSITKTSLGTGHAWNAAYLCYYAAGMIVMLATGVFAGFVLGKGTRVGVILYIVFVSIVAGAVIGAMFMASAFMGEAMDNGVLWINVEWNSPAMLVIMQLAAIALYGIASAFTAGRFKKMEVVC